MGGIIGVRLEVSVAYCYLGLSNTYLYFNKMQYLCM